MGRKKESPSPKGAPGLAEPGTRQTHRRQAQAMRLVDPAKAVLLPLGCTLWDATSAQGAAGSGLEQCSGSLDPGVCRVRSMSNISLGRPIQGRFPQHRWEVCIPTPCVAVLDEAFLSFRTNASTSTARTCRTVTREERASFP